MPAFERTAGLFAGFPGVVGAFRGLRRRGGLLTREPCLSIHVKRKRANTELPGDERIPHTVDGTAIDVIAVGLPRLHSSVDSLNELRATYDDLGRKSSISATTLVDGELQMLGSGHGLLPVDGSGIASGCWSADAGMSVEVVGTSVNGTLRAGQAGSDSDFALVSFPDVDPSNVRLGHSCAPSPIPLAGRSVNLGDTVFHVASARGYKVSGTVAWLPIPGRSITLFADGSVNVSYQSIFGVATDGFPFSMPAESGSTVFNDRGHAVGFVVGAGTDPDGTSGVSYVLTAMGPLADALGDVFSLFFERLP